MARTQRTPQNNLKGMGQQPESKNVSCPQNMHAVERYGLKFANERGGRATGELVQCSTGAAACSVGLASPTCR